MTATQLNKITTISTQHETLTLENLVRPGNGKFVCGYDSIALLTAAKYNKPTNTMTASLLESFKKHNAVYGNSEYAKHVMESWLYNSDWSEEHVKSLKLSSLRLIFDKVRVNQHASTVNLVFFDLDNAEALSELVGYNVLDSDVNTVYADLRSAGHIKHDLIVTTSPSKALLKCIAVVNNPKGAAKSDLAKAMVSPELFRIMDTNGYTAMFLNPQMINDINHARVVEYEYINGKIFTTGYIVNDGVDELGVDQRISEAYEKALFGTTTLVVCGTPIKIVRTYEPAKYNRSAFIFINRSRLRKLREIYQRRFQKSTLGLIESDVMLGGIPVQYAKAVEHYLPQIVADYVAKYCRAGVSTLSWVNVVELYCIVNARFAMNGVRITQGNILMFSTLLHFMGELTGVSAPETGESVEDTKRTLASIRKALSRCGAESKNLKRVNEVTHQDSAVFQVIGDFREFTQLWLDKISECFGTTSDRVCARGCTDEIIEGAGNRFHVWVRNLHRFHTLESWIAYCLTSCNCFIKGRLAEAKRMWACKEATRLAKQTASSDTTSS